MYDAVTWLFGGRSKEGELGAMHSLYNQRCSMHLDFRIEERTFKYERKRRSTAPHPLHPKRPRAVRLHALSVPLRDLDSISS